MSFYPAVFIAVLYFLVLETNFWFCHCFLVRPPSNHVGLTNIGLLEDAESQDIGCLSTSNVTAADLNRAVVYREEEEEVGCLPSGVPPQTRFVFLVSDATGVTARSTLLKCLAQFDTCADDDETPSSDSFATGQVCDVQTRTFTFIRSTIALEQILERAKEKDAFVLYTLADPELRKLALATCQEDNLHFIDLMGPSLEVMGNFLQRRPLGIPALGTKSPIKRRRALGDAYYQRMDAVEFCLKADDGQSPWLLEEADIILVGVSRSGKTPLSVVLSQTMALKVANIPLVMEVPPPSQLLEKADPQRVFCLTISPTELRRIRTSRLERRNVKKIEARHEGLSEAPKSKYADRAYLLQDLNHARKLALANNWTEIDVTGRAVEETAALIVEYFNERFGEHLSTNSFR